MKLTIFRCRAMQKKVRQVILEPIPLELKAMTDKSNMYNP